MNGVDARKAVSRCNVVIPQNIPKSPLPLWYLAKPPDKSSCPESDSETHLLADAVAIVGTMVSRVTHLHH
jgi:hypothetical protein